MVGFYLPPQYFPSPGFLSVGGLLESIAYAIQHLPPSPGGPAVRWSPLVFLSGPSPPCPTFGLPRRDYGLHPALPFTNVPRHPLSL